MSSLDICRPAEVVGEVRRRYTLQTLVDEKGELIVNPLRYFKPVQLAEERGDVYRLCRAGSQDNSQPSATCHCFSRYTRAWTLCRPRAAVGRQQLSLRSSRQRARKLHGYRQREAAVPEILYLWPYNDEAE